MERKTNNRDLKSNAESYEENEPNCSIMERKTNIPDLNSNFVDFCKKANIIKTSNNNIFQQDSNEFFLLFLENFINDHQSFYGKKFKLLGWIDHLVTTIMSGHYTCTILLKKDKNEDRFFNFNDLSVSMSDETIRDDDAEFNNQDVWN